MYNIFLNFFCFFPTVFHILYSPYYRLWFETAFHWVRRDTRYCNSSFTSNTSETYCKFFSWKYFLLFFIILCLNLKLPVLFINKCVFLLFRPQMLLFLELSHMMLWKKLSSRPNRNFLKFFLVWTYTWNLWFLQFLLRFKPSKSLLCFMFVTYVIRFDFNEIMNEKIGNFNQS